MSRAASRSLSSSRMSRKLNQLREENKKNKDVIKTHETLNESLSETIRGFEKIWSGSKENLHHETRDSHQEMACAMPKPVPLPFSKSNPMQGYSQFLDSIDEAENEYPSRVPDALERGYKESEAESCPQNQVQNHEESKTTKAELVAPIELVDLDPKHPYQFESNPPENLGLKKNSSKNIPPPDKNASDSIHQRVLHPFEQPTKNEALSNLENIDLKIEANPCSRRIMSPKKLIALDSNIDEKAHIFGSRANSKEKVANNLFDLNSSATLKDMKRDLKVINNLYGVRDSHRAGDSRSSNRKASNRGNHLNNSLNRARRVTSGVQSGRKGAGFKENKVPGGSSSLIGRNSAGNHSSNNFRQSIGTAVPRPVNSSLERVQPKNHNSRGSHGRSTSMLNSSLSKTQKAVSKQNRFQATTPNLAEMPQPATADSKLVRFQKQVEKLTSNFDVVVSKLRSSQENGVEGKEARDQFEKSVKLKLKEIQSLVDNFYNSHGPI